MMTIDIDSFLNTVAEEVQDKDVPVVDLIAVQSRDPYKILVATILSARTRDETTAAAASRLFKTAPDLKSLAALTTDKIEHLIRPVGFFRNKADYLSKLPDALKKFNNIIPDTLDELITLPGVGRKTANLVLSVAFQKEAICVDTHVHRIMNIWGYVKTNTPLETEMALRQTLPRKYWRRVNSLLVAFGQSICRPVRPHCDSCRLKENCPRINVTPRRVTTGKPSKEKNVSTLISWNVNGIRAIEKKGFLETVEQFDADILAIQETRAHANQLPEKLLNIPGYDSFWHSAERKGYSGVAIYTRLKPLRVIEGLGIEQFDREGRVLSLEFPRFFLINTYFPNSGHELKRLDFKLQFNNELLAFAERLKKQKSVVICGDYNVAHRPIDLKNPESNQKNAGYTPEERQWMDNLLQRDFIDTFRLFNQEPDNYTWWSYRFNARARNIGWRIDYFCVDAKSKEFVQDAKILSDIMGSDHCPVQLDYSGQ